MVAAGRMGLAAKTDGAAISSGEITAALFYPDPNDPARVRAIAGLVNRMLDHRAAS